MKPATEKTDVEKPQESQEQKKPEIEQLKILKIELEKKEQKIKELTETAKRVQAEFENYKKMSEKRNSEFVACASKEIMKKLLPVLDSLELAVKNGSDREKLIKGVELVYAQLYSALEEEGLQKINALNQKFDPYKEEAVLTEPTQNEAEDDIVCEELQKGYMLNNAVLRTSKVRIKKFKAEKGEQQ
jgi:molecular chaperone GrpE